MNTSDISKMTVNEIKAFPDPGDAFITLLEKDSRKGVREYAKQLRRKEAKERELLEKTLKKREVEYNLKNLGFTRICGLDEVGRGPLAGPVTVAAVIMPLETTICGVNDSKQLSRKKREELDRKIREEALAYSIVSLPPKEIDRINILQATKEAMRKAVAELETEPEILLIDALTLNSGIEELAIVEGDATCYPIGAASIIAKVHRDELMREYHKMYPEYGFDHNVGYGTAEHIRAIQKYGLTPIHRRSFCHKFL